MCDKLVFDLSQEVEGSPNVFIRKDWINILDNMNQNYQNNQCIIDTSQLANSNKYMSYREAYLAMPLTATAQFKPVWGGGGGTTGGDNYVSDMTFGLKNWFGSMIHSFTLDYNGTTIIQQTPFINMWNIFKLLTSLSYQDVMTMGPTIGFYPDNGGSFTFTPATTGTQALNVGNNDMAVLSTIIDNNYYNCYNQLFTSETAAGNYLSLGGNEGLTYRTKWIAYDQYNYTQIDGASATYANLCPSASAIQVWKSYISTKATIPNGSLSGGTYTQTYSIMAIIYLRHVHSFFNMCPLLKGVFMKMTMNLNNCSSTIYATTDGSPAVTPNDVDLIGYTTTQPVGGVCPFIFPSGKTGNRWMADVDTSGHLIDWTCNYNISVGSRCTDASITNTNEGTLSKSVYLYVPAYTFNPPFEEAYLSNSVKQIKYTDVYQYQYQQSIDGGQPFNFLVTNGIANIKSVLIIPFFKKGYYGNPAPVNPIDYSEYTSPFDTAGCGTTAPMVPLGNFNVQISGQNAIYNTQRYTYEEFVNQLYGQNAVNGGMTDGINSGLINFLDFQMAYSYYYVNVERMLPVEQSVPKSVQVVGTNFSPQALQFWIFVEYGVEIKIDVLTGARV